MAAKINIVVSGYPQGNPGDPIIHPYSVIESSAPTVNLSLTDDTGVNQYFWSFLGKPVGSTSTIQNATTPSASFTPDIALAGTYLVQCSINNGATVVSNGLGFTTEILEVRIPSAKETDEFDSLIGWDAAMQDFMRKVDAQIFIASDSYWSRFDGSGSGGVGYYLSPALSERVSIPAGTRAAPSVVFSNDIDTGLWSPSSGIISTAIGGTPGVQLRRNGTELFLETYDVDNSGYEFTILHHKEGAGSPATLVVRASGTDSNDGSSLSLESVGGPTSGTVNLEISAIDGSSCTLDISAVSNSNTATNLNLNSTTEGAPSLEVLCQSTGAGWATMRLACESSGYGASLILGCKGATEGRLQIGEYDTGKIAFLSSDIYASASWTGDYVYLIEDSTELDAYFAAYGEVSIISALASIGGGGSLWQRTGTVLSPLTSGDTARVGAGSAADVGVGFEGTDTTGLYQKSPTEVGLAINGSTDSYFGRSEIGGTYGDRPSFMGEEPIGVVAFADDAAHAGAANLLLTAKVTSATEADSSRVFVESKNDSENGTGAYVYIRTYAIETDAYVDISSMIEGTTAASVVAQVDINAYNSSSEQYTDAIVAIYAEAVNSGLAMVLLENSTTDIVGFSDAYFDGASLGWSADYLTVSRTIADWTVFDAIFGGAFSSLITSINCSMNEVLFSPAANTPLTSSSGALAVDGQYGNIFEVSVSENITTTTFSNMTGPYGNFYYGRRIKIRFSFGGSYTVTIAGISGGLFVSGATDIAGTVGQVYILHVDELGGGRRYCRIEGPYSS